MKIPTPLRGMFCTNWKKNDRFEYEEDVVSTLEDNV